MVAPPRLVLPPRFPPAHVPVVAPPPAAIHVAPPPVSADDAVQAAVAITAIADAALQAADLRLTQAIIDAAASAAVWDNLAVPGGSL